MVILAFTTGSAVRWIGQTFSHDGAALLAAFSYRPEYYHFDQDEAVNFLEHGVQNSRGFRALKVWLQLRQVGRAAYARMIEEDIALARRFHEIAGGREELEAFGTQLSITTYRYVPKDLADTAGEAGVRAYLNELNKVIQARMERGGEAFVSNAVLGDVYALRMCVVNFRTIADDVVALADISERLGRQADAELRPEDLR